MGDPSKVDCMSGINLPLIKLDSWIFRNPDLYQNTVKSTTSVMFDDKGTRPRTEDKRPLDKSKLSKIEEAINAKMRSVNIASSSKIGLTGTGLGRGADSPTHDEPSSDDKRSTSAESIIVKINSDQRSVADKQQGTTSFGNAQHNTYTNKTSAKDSKFAGNSGFPPSDGSGLPFSFEPLTLSTEFEATKNLSPPHARKPKAKNSKSRSKSKPDCSTNTLEEQIKQSAPISKDIANRRKGGVPEQSQKKKAKGGSKKQSNNEGNASAKK